MTDKPGLHGEKHKASVLTYSKISDLHKSTHGPSWSWS